MQIFSSRQKYVLSNVSNQKTMEGEHINNQQCDFILKGLVCPNNILWRCNCKIHSGSVSWPSWEEQPSKKISLTQPGYVQFLSWYFLWVQRSVSTALFLQRSSRLPFDGREIHSLKEVHFSDHIASIKKPIQKPIYCTPLFSRPRIITAPISLRIFL